MRNLIYGSVIPPFGASGGDIAVIDPVGSKVLRLINLTSAPNVLAISKDGNYLYVGLDEETAIQRIALGTDTLDQKSTLSDFGCGSGVATDIEVLPDSPRSIAVTSKTYANTKCLAVRSALEIYDNGVPRSKNLTGDLRGGGPLWIEFGDHDDILYEIFNSSRSILLFRAHGRPMAFLRPP